MQDSKTTKMVEPSSTEVPYLQITVNTDPLHTDLQLQQALRLNASRESLTSFHSAAQSPTHSPQIQGTSTPKNRKHARSLSCTSDLSEISGRFDDADEVDAFSGSDGIGGGGEGGDDGIMARAMMDYEHYSPVHSAKRNRGNEWSYIKSPLRAEWSHSQDQSQSQSQSQGQNQGQGQGQDDDKRESFSRRWRIGRRGGTSSHGSSPRATNSPRAAASPRAMASGAVGAIGAGVGRRSRFVENMNDGISEKPPSIFLRERGEGKAGPGRSIFRFGRAIASAFNPFGWGGSTGAGAGAGGSADERRQQQLQLQQQQDISRVQMAYEELKKSGYKGVVQHYPAQRAPEQNGIQETAPGPATVATQETKTEPAQERTRTSLQLRRTKSTNNSDSEDRKSRKDLIRQEKLLKKVNTLEDKLERARRELRDLGGEVVEVEEPVESEEEAVSVPVQMGYTATTDYYPRRFVPGALPTLPSERCLAEQAGEDAEDAGAGAEAVGPLQSLSPNIIRTSKDAKDTSNTPKDAKQDDNTTLETPKSKEKANTLKRKSPDPSALEALELNIETTPTPTNKIRKAKLQKMGISDSPGSVDRMNQDSSNNNTPKRTNSGRRKQYTSPQSSPSARRKPSQSPSLTRQDSRMDIDGETTDTDTDTKDLLMLSSSATDLSSQQQNQQQQDTQRSSFYLQDQHAINEDHEQGLSPSPSVSTRRSNSNRSRKEYIPPVPPLPKDLAATAAKVDKRLAKELARRQGTWKT